MLLTADLIKNVEEKYIPMLKTVNIPDFVKCIAQFSGLPIDRINMEVIKRYLLTWAKNKYRFYEMLGNKTRLDQDFTFNDLSLTMEDDMLDISKDFPTYHFWLKYFKNCTSNKISNGDLPWSARCDIKEVFGDDFNLSGWLITRFFKNKLQAPDELVTRIAALYEDKQIKAKYTISIDPVDMMLASETPYNWDSCYRLEHVEGSHADGCLAAVLDTTSLITYTWNKEGKYSLYGEYELSKVRYKRFRQTIAISDNFDAIHFNLIYPKKQYSDSQIGKMLRGTVEAVVCDYTKEENLWTVNHNTHITRELEYGYSEYSDSYLYVLSKNKEQYADMVVFDEPIECPCGCGNNLPGSDEYDEDECTYTGEGFVFENYTFKEWCNTGECYCEYAGDICECNCEDCWAWKREHPICGITGCACSNPDCIYSSDMDEEGEVDPWTAEGCNECETYKEAAAEQEREEQEENKDLKISASKLTITPPSLDGITYISNLEAGYGIFANNYITLDNSGTSITADLYN